MEEKSLKGKISQILLENKAIYGASEGYSILSGEKKCSKPSSKEQLKSLGIIVSKKSVTLSPHIYNRDSEYIIAHLNKVKDVKQLEDMIYKYCRKMGRIYDEKDSLTTMNLVPERTYKEGKYKKIAEEIFPLIAAYKSC